MGGANSTGSFGGTGGSGVSAQNSAVQITGGAFTGGVGGTNSSGIIGGTGGNGLTLLDGVESQPLSGLTCAGGTGGTGSMGIANSGNGLYVYNADVTVNGGTFSGSNAFYADESEPNPTGKTYDWRVTGGVFTGDWYGLYATYSAASTLSVTGGTFTGGSYGVLTDRAGALMGGTFTGSGERAYAVSSATPQGDLKASALLAGGKAYFGADGQKIDGSAAAQIGQNATIRVLDANAAPTPVYTISGTVTNSSDTAVSGATVKLMKGSTEVAKTTTNESGEYSFANVEAGIYNVVATKDALTMTILVQLTDENATEKNIKLPSGSKSSVVEVTGASTPAVVVGGVEEVAEAQTPNTGESVTVKLTVEQQDEPANKSDIEAVAAGKTVGLFLDLSLLKTVVSSGQTQSENITNTQNIVLEVAIPYDFTNKQDVTVYRFHSADPEAMELAELFDKPSVPTDGTFWLDREFGYIHVYASKFSTYAIGYNTPGDGFTGIYVPSEKPLPFTDVKSSDWFYSAVRYVYERGIMLGSSDTSFSPATSAQRGMIAAILWRLEGSPAASAARAFSDVADSAYYARAVAWADANGVAVGYGNGAFGPMDEITREQLAAIIWRYAGSPDVGGMALAEFTDGGSVSPWAYKAMLWAVQKGVITGKDGALDPQGCATRAEVAAILTRYLQAK